MAWIKRNLLFVVGLAVALALVSVGVFYLLDSMQEAERISADLDAKNQSLEALVNRDPFPNTANIDKLKAELKRVSEFKTKAKEKFGQDGKLENLDNASFKALLEGVISNLEREADRSGVSLPDKYDFTFGEQRKRLQLAANSLSPLAIQLQDLSGICQILFTAKIHTLSSLKRTAVGTNDVVGGNDFISKKITPNTTAGTIAYPYEITFQCFSTGLGGVLGGFINASQAYVLKTINIERGASMDRPSPVTAMAFPPRMDANLARRYGMGAPPPQQIQPPAATRAGEVVLDEKPLRVTIRLEIVKMVANTPSMPKNTLAR